MHGNYEDEKMEQSEPSFDFPVEFTFSIKAMFRSRHPIAPSHISFEIFFPVFLDRLLPWPCCHTDGQLGVP